MSDASLPEPRPAANQGKLPAIDKPDGKHWVWWMAVPLAMGLVILCALYFRRATLPPRIAIGQELSIARAVAQSRGYELQDASQLALDPMPDAFYLDLPANRGLIVYRSSKTDTVKALDLVDNWNRGRAHPYRADRRVPALRHQI
jgi:hypothetical protein